MSASRTAISAESAECAIKFPTDAGGAAEKMGMDPPASDTYPADAMIGGGEEDDGRVGGDRVVVGTIASRRGKSAPISSRMVT